jgi:hypothetical protein
MRRCLMPLIAALLTSALVAVAAMGAGSAPRHGLPKTAHVLSSTKRTSHSKAACSRLPSPKAPTVPVRSSAPCTHAPAPPVAVIPGA